MTPIIQTEFVHETGRGNCLQACIASLVERPLLEVPYFIDSDEWEINMKNFIEDNGFKLIECDINDGEEYMLVFGGSPRGDFGHSVIYKMGKLAHDPHPSNDGVKDIYYCAKLIKNG